MFYVVLVASHSLYGGLQITFFLFIHNKPALLGYEGKMSKIISFLYRNSLLSFIIKGFYNTDILFLIFCELVLAMYRAFNRPALGINMFL